MILGVSRRQQVAPRKKPLFAVLFPRILIFEQNFFLWTHGSSVDDWGSRNLQGATSAVASLSCGQRAISIRYFTKGFWGFLVGIRNHQGSSRFSPCFFILEIVVFEKQFCLVLEAPGRWFFWVIVTCQCAKFTEGCFWCSTWFCTSPGSTQALFWWASESKSFGGFVLLC